MTRRLVQVAVVAVFVATAVPTASATLHELALVAAVAALLAVAFGLVLRPFIYGVRRQHRREDQRRDWPWE
jgi:membrane protein implicated in regulation of membrane protease activity